MTKTEIIEKVTEQIENAPKEAGRIQLIFLGGGGWIEATNYDITEEEE